MNYSTSQIITLNMDVRFVIGFLLKRSDRIFDIDLFGSHQRTANKWEKLDYSRVHSENEVFLKFKKPNNFFQFKIVCHGFSLNYDELSYVFFQPLTDIQIFKTLREKRVQFTGCVRNCAGALEATIFAFEKLGALFQDYRINLVESDSEDNTLTVLEALKAKNSRIDFFSLGTLKPNIENRIQRISYCRNQLLDYITPSDYDYLIVADMDGVVSDDLTIESFISNFRFMGCWGACFPINSSFYYDLYAFRSAEIAPTDPIGKLNQIEYVWGERNAKMLTSEPLQKVRFQDLKGWLEVESAFGGMGIYCTDIIKAARYSAVSHDVLECEHVGFHTSIKRQSDTRLFVNPNFVVNNNNGV